MNRRVLASLPALALSAIALLGPQSASAQLNPDLGQWSCLGHCGASGADGDITLSPVGSEAYGYLSTQGSSARQVSHLLIEESGGHGSSFVQANGSSYTSPTFSLGTGQAVDAWFNYVSTDGKGFDDYAWARLVNTVDGSTQAWLFTARSTNGSKQGVVPGNALDKATNNDVPFDPNQTLVNYDDFDFHSRNTAMGDPIEWSPLGDSNGTCWRDNAEGCGYTGWLHAVVTPGAGSYRLEIGVVNFGDELYDSGIAFDVAGLTLAPVPEPGRAALLLAGLALLSLRRRGRRRNRLG